MKKFFILLVLSILCGSASWAQKIGYTDMEFITSKMPEYQLAQTEMKKFSEKWAKEIQDKFSEIDRMQRAYMAEEILLTEDLKRKRQSEIKEKELEAGEYNSKIFGMEGLLFQKKKELMKPVLEKVQRAVTKVCSQRRLDFMFDKSSDVGMLYTNPKHDYSDYVMEELGIDTKTKAAAGDKVGKLEQPPVQAPTENSPKQKSTNSKLK
ncbi:OmpH family outer membrane protein [Dyadobacter fanqingshengii]|uniref:OmpH family outer membrane protein n=1 Tax=Dyadobacter fanqingshengii TaxID=2906443 RepID=A0A9X1P6L0_9BACT|nr:OmpH family outer membrane protein [Dyadobacter fanqingshengii]MCF0038897.1 OmpH family outer membrane protein [Dyadobacter fanqingshengii]MCF2503560.1 OmpH family outer membrane protein [Dyadobacter fanqingshengii]USJ34279.1 OmpH family outer membrane protein [Dyadobacter fanqingshengii]